VRATLAKLGDIAMARMAENARVMFSDLNRMGMTSYIDMGGRSFHPKYFEPVRTLADQHSLTMRVFYNIWLEPESPKDVDSVLDKIKGITAYSSIHRLFTEAQRLALQAVDGGCTFPHCPIPAGWCEIDHIINYAQGGPTLVDHGVPACRVHNVLAKAQGWQSTRINGRAAWIPPPWIDPEQKPRYNHFHDTGLGLPQPE